MENAAKALSIAGGILIAVMLAVLVYYVFTHWGESQRIKQEDVEFTVLFITVLIALLILDKE